MDARVLRQQAVAAIEAALRQRKVSRAQLADELGVTPGAVSHWLNGRRPVPPAALERIAAILRLESRSLRPQEAAGTSGRHSPTAERRSEAEPRRAAGSPETTMAWHFRPAPEDGGRDFGNPNIWATPPDVPTLVRETGQNSVDAARDGRVHIRFTLIQLTRGKESYDRFLEALRFDQLRVHLEAAAHTRSKLGTRLRGGLERLESEPRLLLLRVDDYGTTGLEGEEKDDDRSFAALVRDNLFSAKTSPTAGGSFGLGKAVLWRCSDISTVVFGSHLGSYSEGSARSRLIGKTELTWHRVDGEPFAGPGWLSGPAMESVWDADELLEDLYVPRTPLPEGVEETFGTSILIVGFRDPQAEVGATPEELMERLAAAAAENFWPAMRNDRLEVSVEVVVDGTRVERLDVAPDKYVRPFCEALERHREDRVAEQLAEPGDVVRVSVPLSIPSTRSEAEDLIAHDDVDGHCLLLVRLSESEDHREDQLLNSVALIRGRGMVTRYLAQSGIVVGGRPFHAVLLAGEAVGGEPNHRLLDQFLRLAEPPAHDKWEYNEELREKYNRGSAARLRELHRAITSALRDVIKPAETGEEDVPPELRRLLQLDSASPEAPPATLRRVESTLADGVWQVEGEIHVNDRKKRWALTPRLWLEVESGGRPRVMWRALDAIEGNVERDGDALILDPGTRRVTFRGTSDPTSHQAAADMCRARLDLTWQELSEN